jgi:pyrroline-5-carboxylate reductase
MGEALLRGVVHGELLALERVLVSARTPERLADVGKRLGVRTTLDNRAVVAQSDVVILSVKPQQLDAVLLEVSDALRPGQLLISLAAGITTSHIEGRVGQPLPVIRVMPNTPALIGLGASAYCRGQFATAEHALVAHALLGVVGVALEVPEALIDPVTAVSGSGPAYVFYTIEAMIRGAVELGMEERLARLLVKQTVLGAARLVMDSGEDPTSLRMRVTSKGGTTEAAIRTLEACGYQAALGKAMGAALERARELNSEGKDSSGAPPLARTP